MSPSLQFVSKYWYIHFLNWQHQVNNSINKLESYNKIVQEKVFEYFSVVPWSLHKDAVLTFLIEKAIED